jgi:hypothetical protein
MSQSLLLFEGGPAMKHVLRMITVALFAMTVMAQAKPDFSGRWTSEPEAKTTEPGSGPSAARTGDMGSGWGTTPTFTQTAERLTVEYMFFARGDMQPPLRFVYALDGAETKNSVMLGRGIQIQTSKTTWEGDKLIISTTHIFDNPATGQPMKTEVKQTLTLASPTQLIVETTRGGVLGAPAATTRTVYRKP